MPEREPLIRPCGSDCKDPWHKLETTQQEGEPFFGICPAAQPHGCPNDPVCQSCPCADDDDVCFPGERLRAERDLMAGTLTLWLNLAPVAVRSMRPGPNGKSLAELTREALDA